MSETRSLREVYQFNTSSNVSFDTGKVGGVEGGL